MSSLPQHVIECPQCQTGLDLSELPDPAPIRCPKCDCEVLHVGLFPVPVEDLPAGNDAIDWMLQQELEPVAADDLPARVCPWCGRNVGVRASCPECGSDMGKTGRLLLKQSAAGLDEELCGLLKLQATGPFSAEARLARLLRLPPGRAIEMGLDRRYVAYLPDSIPEIPGLATELGGGTRKRSPAPTGSAAASEPEPVEVPSQTFRCSLGRRVFGRASVLLGWFLLTVLVGASAGFGLVIASGSSNPTLNVVGMVGSILAMGLLFWGKFSPSMLGALTVSAGELVAHGALLKRRWRTEAVSSIELQEEAGMLNPRVKVTSGKESWSFSFGDETETCAEALRQVCRNAAFVDIDGETQLPAMPDDPSLARCSLGNTYLRRGRTALLAGIAVAAWFGPLAVLTTMKGKANTGVGPVYFWTGTFAAVCVAILGVGLIRKGRRVLKA